MHGYYPRVIVGDMVLFAVRSGHQEAGGSIVTCPGRQLISISMKKELDIEFPLRVDYRMERNCIYLLKV